MYPPIVFIKPEQQNVDVEDLFECPYMRLSVITKLNEAIQRSGAIIKSSINKIERHIFKKAISKTVYLNNAAKLIFYFQNTGLQVSDILQRPANATTNPIIRLEEILEQLTDP